jgi:feruloyl esterase
VLASHVTTGKVDRTRPLCPYPKMAHYKGTGDPNDAANFVCQ